MHVVCAIAEHSSCTHAPPGTWKMRKIGLTADSFWLLLQVTFREIGQGICHKGVYVTNPSRLFTHLQEALISRGGTKSEAAAAENMFKSLVCPYNPDSSDSPYSDLLSASSKGRTEMPAPGSSPRDAVPASSSDADASVAAVKDGGATSARGVAPSNIRGGAVAAVGVSPRDAVGASNREAIIDYTMFEQLWMADLTNPTAKAV